MVGLKLSFLGSPQIEHNGELLEISASKALALLVYLAMAQQNHSRDTLGTLLWPDNDQSQARTYLRHALWSLKKEVGEKWLYISREQIGFQAGEDVWLDVVVFREKVTAVAATGSESEVVETAVLSPAESLVDEPELLPPVPTSTPRAAA